MNADNDWIKDLKVGELVLTSGRFSYSGKQSIEKVVTIQPSGRIVLTDKSTYNPNGTRRGCSGYTSGRIVTSNKNAIQMQAREDFCQTVCEKLAEIHTMNYERAVEINKLLHLYVNDLSKSIEGEDV